MLKSTEKIIDHKLHQHLIREQDLSSLFKGSNARRYALVNKALNKGELIRLSRGYYMLAEKYLETPFSQLYLANRLVPNSFISAESALSFHGWIPERVTQVTSVCAFGRSRDYDTPAGFFAYLVPPIDKKLFYFGVSSISINNKVVGVASPLRALIDYIYWHRIKAANINWLKNSMRIEATDIASITTAEAKLLRNIYCVSYVNNFLQEVVNAS